MVTNFDKKNFIKNFKANCKKIQVKNFIKGETVTTYIEKRNQICIVLSGEVDLIRYDFNGNKTTILDVIRYYENAEESVVEKISDTCGDQISKIFGGISDKEVEFLLYRLAETEEV